MIDRKEYYKKWREKNKDYVKQKEKERNDSDHRKKYKKEYSLKKREYLNELQKEWRKKNPERTKEIEKKRYEKNPQKRKDSVRKTYKKRRLTDPIFRMSENIRRQILLSIQKDGYAKKSRTQEILGCSYDEFKIHLENQFEPWMNWENYGLYNGELNYGWDIDHVIPKSIASTEEELIKLNHHTNLKPLCSKVNRDMKRNNPQY